MSLLIAAGIECAAVGGTIRGLLLLLRLLRLLVVIGSTGVTWGTGSRIPWTAVKGIPRVGLWLIGRLSWPVMLPGLVSFGIAILDCWRVR